MRWLTLAVMSLLLITTACAGGGGPEQPLNDFVASVNDTDFNDAYGNFTSRCHEVYSLEEFQEIYGQTLLAFGIGASGFAGGSTLRAEDVQVERIGEYEAEITLDWVLHSSIDNPLPLLGTIAEENVPLNTVLEVAGTPQRPLYVVDQTGGGDWRLDDCDPLGLKEAYDELGY